MRLKSIPKGEMEELEGQEKTQEKLKVFICWSKERSKAVAEALRSWLPNVFQSVECFLSTADVDKGAKWRQVISGELEQCNFGIICLTPENLESPWLLFEAGALSKKDQSSRVCTYLFQVKYEDIKDPLSQFQHTITNQQDTSALVGTLNRALGNNRLEEKRLETAFKKWWPDLEEFLDAVPGVAPQPIPEGTTDSEKISEILTRVREMERSLKPSWSFLAEDIAARMLEGEPKEGRLRISPELVASLSPLLLRDALRKHDKTRRKDITDSGSEES